MMRQHRYALASEALEHHGAIIQSALFPLRRSILDTPRQVLSEAMSNIPRTEKSNVDFLPPRPGGRQRSLLPPPRNLDRSAR